MRPTTLPGHVLATLFAGSPAPARTAAAGPLKSAGDFAAIADPAGRSRAPSAGAGKVMVAAWIQAGAAGPAP